MTPPEAVLDGRPVTAGRREVRISGWGGGPGVRATLVRAGARDALLPVLSDAAAQRGAIARGLGRSYGDAAQRAGGLVIDTKDFRGFRVEPATGIVTAGAGVTLAELLEALVPRGWIVPVVPGTQHVTVGGAIASDIHGKNHGVAGTFGAHVRALGLLTSEGEELELEPGAPGGVFEATLGGMGLTGLILWARIAMRPVRGTVLSVDTDRATDIDHALAMLSEPGGSHRVAWLDLLGPRAGRGIVTRAEHVDSERSDGATVKARAIVPKCWPSGVLHASTVALVNELRFRRAPRRERGAQETFAAHMFPLDALDAWPRLYGPAGFVQYQLVVPPGQDGVLHAVIGQLRAARVPCFLAVLKDFGPANGAPLSFPIEGWTLALDLPRRAPGLLGALRRCDELVAAAGGRVYLSKDSRMEPDALKAMYPRLAEWQAIRDQADPAGVWRSDLAVRTGLVTV